MATRKVFIDIDETAFITPLIEDELFALHIRGTNDELKVLKYNKTDAKELIMELYRLKKQL